MNDHSTQDNEVFVSAAQQSANFSGDDSSIKFSVIWKAASAALKGYWLRSILAVLIPIFIGVAVNFIPFISLLSGILLFPLTVGGMLYFLRLVRCENPSVESVFEPFRQYWHMLWGYLRVAIFIFLHFLLLIIPGYVAMMRYSMTYFVMLDHPEITVKEAMILSREMMYGHKLQFFGYMLLLGLISILVIVFTLSIGLLWFGPFVHTFGAVYYTRVSAEYQRKLAAAAAAAE